MSHIRAEQEEDTPVVRALNERAFGRPDEGRLVDAVRQRQEPTISLVAVTDEADDTSERIIGHILLSPVSITGSKGTQTAIGLGPMSVDPDFQKQGVGSRLVERGLELSREAGYSLAVVLGPPTFYPRFGFVMARTKGLHWEHEMPGDPFMVMELRPGALEGVSGEVRYLPEFMSI